jgi:chromosome segregation ATPase
MKNPTILKDELGLLRAGRSAVLKELQVAGNDLERLYLDRSNTENELAELRITILEETARLDDMRGRAVLVKKELDQYTQDLRNIRSTWETVRVKNSQEQKLHLGRIKEYKDKEEELSEDVSKLKSTYDNNLKVYLQHEQERSKKLRAINLEIDTRENELKKIEIKLEKDIEEDKKITKERLKREDKIRARERALEAREDANSKKEEDLMTMAADMTIVYGRLKELYATVNPEVDLDKLIMQAI